MNMVANYIMKWKKQYERRFLDELEHEKEFMWQNRNENETYLVSYLNLCSRVVLREACMKKGGGKCFFEKRSFEKCVNGMGFL